MAGRVRRSHDRPAEQAEIVSEVDAQLSTVIAAQNEVERSEQRVGRLRQSILQQAFTGQLVPQDPTDEPARTLLERLRASRPIESKPKLSRAKRK